MEKEQRLHCCKAPAAVWLSCFCRSFEGSCRNGVGCVLVGHLSFDINKDETRRPWKPDGWIQECHGMSSSIAVQAQFRH